MATRNINFFFYQNLVYLFISLFIYTLLYCPSLSDTRGLISRLFVFFFHPIQYRFCFIRIENWKSIMLQGIYRITNDRTTNDPLQTGNKKETFLSLSLSSIYDNCLSSFLSRETELESGSSFYFSLWVNLTSYSSSSEKKKNRKKKK